MDELRNLAAAVARDAPPSQPLIIELQSDGAERIVTFQQGRERIAGVARTLVQRGLNRHDAVAITAANSADYLLTYLGIMHAGLIAVPVNGKLPRKTVERILCDSSAKLVFADEECRSLVDNVPTTELGGGPDVYGAASLQPRPSEACVMEPEDAATILYTSGTGGVPKGVPLTHGAYIWALRCYSDMHQAIFGQRTLVAAPLYHMNALFLSLLLMYLGGTNVLMTRFTPAGYLRAIAKYRCTTIGSVPTMLALAAREVETLRQLDLRCVQSVLTGSAPITEDLLRRVQALFPNAVVSNSWGTTESGPVCFGAHPERWPRPPLSLGYPRPDIELKLEGGPSADEGVLHIRSRAVMAGYLNRPDDTARCLSEGWYDTGDIMRRDEHGFYFFVGRADDRINCGGENVYPSEIEKLLERHPDVSQAAVVPIPDAIKQQVPVAFIVPHPSADPSEDSIRQFALQEGPAYAHPRAVFVVSELPLAGTNKIDRIALIEFARTHIGRTRGS